MARHETRYVYDETIKMRIERFLLGTERVSNFVQRAVEERLNRLEARDERAAREVRMKDKQWLLGLLNEINDGGREGQYGKN